MIYTVAEVSKLIKLSKASIYTKLKTVELQDHIIKKQGVTYIDEIGLKLIQESLKEFLEEDIKDFKENTKDFKEDINDLNYNAINDEISIDMDYINSLKEDINYFKDQIKVKDLQNKELNERLKQEQELNKNNQILQLKQPQDIKLLEAHFEDLDQKLEDVKNNMLERKEHQNKGFFSKIFKK